MDKHKQRDSSVLADSVSAVIWRGNIPIIDRLPLL